MGKDDSHDIAAMDSPRRCSDGEDDGASDRSGTARKDKSFTMAHRSDFQNKGVNHMSDNKPKGQTASHCTNGGVDIVAQDGTHLSAEQIQHHVSLLQQDLLDMKIQGVKPYSLEQGREVVKGNPQVQPAPEMEPRRGHFTAARREFLTAENGTATRADRDSGRDVTEAPHRADRGGWGTQSLCDLGLGFEND
ncbi:hypothetical protein SESBI_12044 [Sesbania bispinosa]|nr:hypothetical protein SESBI_12044 [Sesbania bispinosa]